MTNEEFWIQRGGYWGSNKFYRRCSGWNEVADGVDCSNMIDTGERAFFTGIRDRGGSLIILCSECAKRKDGNNNVV